MAQETANCSSMMGSSGGDNNKATSSGPTKARKLAHFYAGKTIFITGATGFIGKVCLLKLMCSLGQCAKIYIVLRPKKGMTPQQRFNKMTGEDPFSADQMDGNNMPDGVAQLQVERMRKIRSIDWSKVAPIEGNMNSEHLGLDEAIRSELRETVDIVFNIAASVQFDAPLKDNLRDNYLGASNILQLATSFKRLISFVHVSTFFVNHHLSHVEERILPLELDCEKMAELIQWLPERELESISASTIMQNRPNTYIITKAMAENLIQKYSGRLPVAIVRPSIVVPARHEPEPGWVDNVNGPMGLGTLGSIGLLRNIDWNYWGVSDFVPVDMVVYSMLAVGERTARLAQQRQQQSSSAPKVDEITVYNCSTSSLNPTTWGETFEKLKIEGLKAPPMKMLRIPIDVPKHKRANKFLFALTKLSEILFAYLIDFILALCGQKRILAKLTAKLHHGYDLLRPFTTNEYTCSNDNLVAAFNELDDDDKQEFDFNLAKLDWDTGFKLSYYGARKRLLKEKLDNIPAALLKMKILYGVEFVFNCMLICLIGWTFLKLYTFAVVGQQATPTIASALGISQNPLLTNQTLIRV